MTDSKRCPVCTETKPNTDFGNSSKYKDGKNWQCRACAYKSQQKWRKTSPKYLLGVARQRKNLRTRIIAHYSEGLMECACCREDADRFLIIDHINGGGNEHRRQVGGSRGMYNDIRKRGFPPGFRVLCHNCNYSYSVDKTCPHQSAQNSDRTERPATHAILSEGDSVK